MAAALAVLRKTRELHNHHFDSTIWNDSRFRDDDVIISTYAKSGMAWTPRAVAEMSPLAGPTREVCGRNIAALQKSVELELN